MSKTYRSAQGRPVNLDAIIVLNEDEIALGNMNVNARGDELGPGGTVVKTRNQIMEEYYKLNTPVATETEAVADNAVTGQNPASPGADLDEDPYGDLEYMPPEAAPSYQPGAVVSEPVVNAPTIQQRAQRSAPSAAPVLQGATRILEDEPLGVSTVAPTPTDDTPTPLLKPAVKPPAGPSEGTALRGSLADAVAKTVTVNQTAHESPKKAGGVKRI